MDDKDTAVALGSGDVAVLGTPRLLAWLEGVTVDAARDRLGEGQTSVGTAVRLRHRRPTPVGALVTVDAELAESADRTDGRLTFTVTATDEHDTTVADGEIDRVVVSRSEFGRSER